VVSSCRSILNTAFITYVTTAEMSLRPFSLKLAQLGNNKQRAE
jgi:hypothetical protein